MAATASVQEAHAGSTGVSLRTGVVLVDRERRSVKFHPAAVIKSVRGPAEFKGCLYRSGIRYDRRSHELKLHVRQPGNLGVAC